MTIAYFCIIIMMFVPIVAAGYAKFSQKGYDNSAPRDFLNKLEGKGKRAHAAQLNTFENFAPFAAGVIVAHQLHANQMTIDALAVSFVFARVLYVIFYIFDNHVLRSTVWFIGFINTIALFFIGGK